MSDDRPDTTPARDLANYVLPGMLDRLRRETDLDAAYENLKRLVRSVCGPGADDFEKRAPNTVAKIRLALLKLGQDATLKSIDQRLAADRLEFEKAKLAAPPADIKPPEIHVHIHDADELPEAEPNAESWSMPDDPEGAS